MGNFDTESLAAFLLVAFASNVGAAEDEDPQALVETAFDWAEAFAKEADARKGV